MWRRESAIRSRSPPEARSTPVRQVRPRCPAPSSLSEDPVGGTVAVVQVGGLHSILTSRRKPYHHIADFTLLGLDPSATDLVIVKIGYLEPELYNLAADWLLALTPGGVDQDLLRLGHHGVLRPLFPFDPDMSTPDLTPELLP